MLRALVRWLTRERTRDPHDTIALATGLWEAEAAILRGRLEAEGIPAFISGTVTGYGYLSPRVWQVVVREGDIERARAILGDEAASG